MIGVPNAVQRLSILNAHTRSMKLSEDVDLAQLAENTLGYVGADLASLCREAAFIAVKRTLNDESNDGPSLGSSNWQKTLKGMARKLIQFYSQTFKLHTE